MAEQWYSIVEYAREFAVSDMTVRRRIKTGRLSAVLRDGKYYIPVSPDQAARLRSTVGQPGHDDDELYSSAPAPRHIEAAPVRETRDSYRRPTQYEATYAPEQRAPAPQPQRPRYAEPAPRETYEARQPARHEVTPRRVADHRPAPTSSSLIPAHILAKLDSYDKSLVDTKALLDFCEHTVNMVNKVEVKLQEQFESKIHSLHSEIHGKNIELNQLQQQVEDLQCLVKILERKSIA